MQSANPDPDQPIAWRAVPEDTEVRAQGHAIGTLWDLLGSHEEDIFHGIVVKLRSGRRVFIPSEDIGLLTATHVDVDLPPDQVEGLPDHREAHEYDLRITGLRRRLGWKEEKDR
jgi:hypothetical protein